MSETKKKAAKQRRELKKTGGGPPPVDLTPLEESVIGIIGNTPIDGIPGGIDVGGETELGTATPGPSNMCESADVPVVEAALSPRLDHGKCKQLSNYYINNIYRKQEVDVVYITIDFDFKISCTIKSMKNHYVKCKYDNFNIITFRAGIT